jgi:hypothetical protein
MKLSMMFVALMLLPSIALADGFGKARGSYNFKVPDCSECSKVYAEQSSLCRGMTSRHAMTVCAHKASQIAGNCRLTCSYYDWRSAWWGNVDP